MRFIVMFVTAVCVLFLISYDSQKKNFYQLQLGIQAYNTHVCNP